MRARSLEVGEAGCVSLPLLTLGLGSQWPRFSASSPGTSKPSCARASSPVSDPLVALLHAVLLRGLPPSSQDVPAQECSQTVNENAGKDLKRLPRPVSMLHRLGNWGPEKRRCFLKA